MAGGKWITITGALGAVTGMATLLALTGSSSAARGAPVADVSYDGTTLTVEATPGAGNVLSITCSDVDFGGDPDSCYVGDSSGDLTVGSGECETSSGPGGNDQVGCTAAGLQKIKVNLGDENDSFGLTTEALPAAESVKAKVNGGDGNDDLQAGHPVNGASLTKATIKGGEGRDVLTGDSPSEKLIGGAGKDSLSGNGGRDKLKAKDGERDKEIDCGSGSNESATVDEDDPKAKSCK